MDTGKARFVYRHFIVVGEESIIAAMGAECAAEQGSFWQFHDALFENWQGANQGHFRFEALQGFAGEIGMDAEQFDDCMTSGRAFERVRAEHLDAESRGVNATPTVLINGERVGGGYEAFQQAIDAALAEGR